MRLSAEVGELSRFDNPKQVQKLAGYAIVKNDSGKHAGESHISYRGRKRLRYVLYEAAISVIGKNAEFREIHQYYQTRDRNPLKKMQSVIAVACKVLRVFYTILKKGVDYNGGKDVTGYPKAWKEHQGSIRNPDIQKEPAVVEANCRYAKQTDSWLQPRRKKEGWNCEKQTERERKTSTGDSAVTGSRSVNVMFTKNEPVVGRYNHHRAGP